MLPLNNDQRRETINTRQRFEAWREARSRLLQQRGSMVWSQSKGIEYLLHSFYDPVTGKRRQKSLGARSVETEAIKTAFEASREKSRGAFKQLEEVLSRQSAINRALGLGRVPLLSARILRAIDEAGLLGKGLRLVDTHALYAYEAMAGVMITPDLTTTEDIDLLFDSRISLRFLLSDEAAEASLIALLQKIDRSFTRSRETFRAINAEGYAVDLLKPLRNPVWSKEREHLGMDEEDLRAVEIEGLVWLENAPQFEAIAMDERGAPVRLVAIDPRVFAAHKLWVSKQITRDPLRKQRDAAQAREVANLVIAHMPHLAYEAGALKMLPKPVFEAGKALFNPT